MSIWRNTCSECPDWQTKVLDREQSVEHLLRLQEAGERMVVARYGDGEANLIKDARGHITESGAVASRMMRDTLTAPGQFPCILRSKPHNVKRKDKWYWMMHYLIQEGGHDLYGNAHVFVHDFLDGARLLRSVFKQPIAIMTSHPKQMRALCERFPRMQHIEVLPEDNTEHAEKYLEQVVALSKDVYGIVFAGGPVSKYVLAQAIDRTECHLLDVGCTMNAVLDGVNTGQSLTKAWPMSWAQGKNIRRMARTFLNLVE